MSNVLPAVCSGRADERGITAGDSWRHFRHVAKNSIGGPRGQREPDEEPEPPDPLVLIEKHINHIKHFVAPACRRTQVSPRRLSADCRRVEFLDSLTVV